MALFADQAMHETIAFYGRQRCVEVPRQIQDESRRVFFRKPLVMPPPQP